MLKTVLNKIIYDVTCVIVQQDNTDRYLYDLCNNTNFTKDSNNLELLYYTKVLEGVLQFIKDDKGDTTDLVFGTHTKSFNLIDDRSNSHLLWNDNNLLGFHTINDIEYFGFATGHSYEIPVFQVFFLDNLNQLRYYVPTSGNLFNTITNTAYGNDSSLLDTFCEYSDIAELMGEWSQAWSDIRDIWNLYPDKCREFKELFQYHKNTYRNMIIWIGYDLDLIKTDIETKHNNTLDINDQPQELQFEISQHMLFQLYFLNQNLHLSDFYSDHFQLMYNLTYNDLSLFNLDYSLWLSTHFNYCTTCVHNVSGLCPLWKPTCYSQCLNFS